ncbi:MAG: methionine aminotransferase [Ginsengibacter sp.]
MEESIPILQQLHLPTKLPETGETIFTVINDLAVKNNAINLGQGFPDFDMNQELIDLAYAAMNKGYNQYAHMNGVPGLLNAISEKIFALYQTQVNNKEEITITPGGTYAIYTALTSILYPGDEVIVFEPAFDSYIPNIEINGAIPVLIPLTFPEYKIDWELVKSKISPATKCIIINSPHNPTGSVIDKNDIAELRKIVENTSIFILSDEVYEHIIFDGIEHQSILRYPDLFQRSFVCFSFGKVYNCTGWKIGYSVAPQYMMKEFRKVHQFNCFSCNAPVQFALAEFLKNKNEYKRLGSFFQAKRDYFQNLMEETSFRALPSFGSYFQLYSYKSLSDDSENNFSRRLCEQAGVACVPVSAFYKNKKDDKVIRFCFAKKEDTIKEAVKRLLTFEQNIV